MLKAYSRDVTGEEVLSWSTSSPTKENHPLVHILDKRQKNVFGDKEVGDSLASIDL